MTGIEPYTTAAVVWLFAVFWSIPPFGAVTDAVKVPIPSGSVIVPTDNCTVAPLTKLPVHGIDPLGPLVTDQFTAKLVSALVPAFLTVICGVRVAVQELPVTPDRARS